MCGIIGIIGTKKSGITQEHYQAFFKAWIKAEQRGTDACGLIVSRRNKLEWWKHNVSASNAVEFVKEKIMPYRANINFMLAHTRFATDGTPEENGNNHPIIVPNKKQGTTLAGIHNGIIWNKRELYEKMKWDPWNEVDSQVAFRLIDHYGLQSLNPFKMLRGSFNLAYATTQDVRSFYLVRHNNPLSLRRGEDYLAFGSMEYYWDTLAGRIEPFEENTWAHIMPDGEIKKKFKSWEEQLPKYEPSQYSPRMRYDAFTGTWYDPDVDKETLALAYEQKREREYYVDPETGTVESRPSAHDDMPPEEYHGGEIWPTGE